MCGEGRKEQTNSRGSSSSSSKEHQFSTFSAFLSAIILSTHDWIATHKLRTSALETNICGKKLFLAVDDDTSQEI